MRAAVQRVGSLGADSPTVVRLMHCNRRGPDMRPRNVGVPSRWNGRCVKSSLGTPSTTEVLPSKPKRPIVNARPSDQNIKTARERHILRFLLVSWLKERFSIHRIGMFRTLGIALLCLVALAPSRVEAEAPTVIVKPGDALSLIAERAGVSVEQIKEWNHLNGDLIRIGQKLVVGPSTKVDPVKAEPAARRLGGGRHRLDAAIRLRLGSSRSTGSSE